MKSNTELKNSALAALKGNWAKAILAAVLVFAVYLVAAGPCSIQTVKVQSFMREQMGYARNASVTEMLNLSQAMANDPEVVAMQTKANGYSGLMYLLIFLVINPLLVGFANAFLQLVRSGDDRLAENTVHIGFEKYWHKVWGMLLRQIFVWLWTLLLIIPGIIKQFSYAMTPFILQENPELSADQAIDRSRAMMKGHKFDLFWLYLSFIGWVLLGMITLGVAYLWIYPYIQTATAAFYEDVKADYEVNGGLI